jgi:thiamine biosynthesis lipoprotein
MARAPRLNTALVVLAVAAAAGWWVRAAPPSYASFEDEAMATRWRVELPERPVAAEEADACFALYRELDRDLSEWKPESPLSAVNAAAGKHPVAVPQDLFDLVARSQAIGRATDGAFDVSWAALWGVWDFRAVPPRVPDAARIAARRALVDYREVRLDPGARTIFLPRAGMQLGLGAIGKGYALARAEALLATRGEHDFLLLGGGQVLARGRHGERSWTVGIRDPRSTPDDSFARLPLEDASLSTSADDESFFVVDGVRYGHILDPRTGWPARGLRSATVLHRDPVLADALSTALFVMGDARGFPVVERLGGEAVVVDDAGRVRFTPGLRGRLEILHAPRVD